MDGNSKVSIDDVGGYNSYIIYISFAYNFII